MTAIRLSSGLTANIARRDEVPAGSAVARPELPLGARKRTTPWASMKYARELLVLIGSGSGAPAALAHVTSGGVLASLAATTLPPVPLRPTVHEPPPRLPPRTPSI